MSDSGAAAAAAVTARTDIRPTVALVLGSGLGHLAEAVSGVRIPYAELPGFPISKVSGHRGELVVGALEDIPVAVFSGRSHYYESGDAAVMRPAIGMLRELGCGTLLLTNAAGSVRSDLAPGDLMLIDDHINWSGRNPLIGEETDARFVGMTRAYDVGLRDELRNAAAAAGETLRGGVYMWFSGPSFETPAEIRMAQILGADAVGMSTVPEVILARFFGLRVAAVSTITNYGAGITGAELSHHETKEVAGKAAGRLERLVRAFLRNRAGA